MESIKFAIILGSVLSINTKKNSVFWDVVPCNLIEIYRGFGGTCYIFSEN